MKEQSGYVVHSLEAALWSVAPTGDSPNAVLMAAYVGHYADTTAAITWQLARTLYRASGIPQEWRAKVAWGERIEEMARGLADAWMVGS